MLLTIPAVGNVLNFTSWFTILQVKEKFDWHDPKNFKKNVQFMTLDELNSFTSFEVSIGFPIIFSYICEFINTHFQIRL